MKKNYCILISGECKIWKSKFLRKMRIVTLLLLISITQTFALESYSQTKRLSINSSNETIIQILDRIEDQSEFYFMFDATIIDVYQSKSIKCENKPIAKVLDQLLEDTNILYEISDRQIVLTCNQESKVVQQKSISGKVTDSSGLPLPGVTVVIKGTTQGTVTSYNGEYSLTNIQKDATLVFSFVGMRQQEIVVGSQTFISISMEVDAIGLEEVVAIGYGTMKKSDLTGSVASVKSNELNAFPTTDVLQALAGRASGVQVSQNNGSPGSSVSIRIRGTNSILGDNEPLYVIDGFPGEIQYINPGDIESVEILKDASATAIYGSRGANGVVLVTTKQGKSGRTQINYESSFSAQQLIKKMDLMNAKEFANLYYVEKEINDGFEPRMTEDEINELGEGTDWQEEIFKTSLIKNHQLNVSGGNDKTDFIISGNMFDQDGIMQGSGYKRYSLRSSINHKVNDKFSVKQSVILTQTTQNVNDQSASTGEKAIIDMTLRTRPLKLAFDEEGEIYREEGEDAYSPFDYILNSSNCSKRKNVNSSLGLLYKLTPDLSFKVSGNINYSYYKNDYYRDSNFTGMLTSTYARVMTSESLRKNTESLILYKKDIKSIHLINAMAGVTTNEYNYTNLNASSQGFVSDVFETYSLSSGETSGIPETSYRKSTILSYLGRVNYSYKDKYLVTLSMRADGSSRFSEGNKWGYFPSGAFAWKIYQEDFMKDISTISDMKLRFGWGVTGSQAIGIYATQVLLSAKKAVFNDSYQNAFAPNTTLPGDLKWETTEQINFGADIGILKNRFRLTVDYYQKKTRDLLNNVQLPASMGWAKTVQNVGEIENKGLEFKADANILSGEFKWDLSGNISFNKNKIIKLYGGQSIPGTSYNVILINDYINLLSEGHSLGEFYGYVEDGYDEYGNIKYKDLTDDGSITDADKTFIGDPNPKFIYGLNSDFEYGNFSLSIFLQGTYGNDLYNLSSVRNTIYYIYNYNLLREVYYDHWTPENTDAKYPIVKSATSSKMSDRFVEDGSYLRLKNIQLGYNLPVQKYGINWLKKLNLSVSGQNLLTFTKYSWWDPDVNSYGGGNSINQGIDFYSYPSYKSVTFSLKATF
uniref:TonB-dependent receptor n=1 Tax=uncultured Draconibacterium sp. TaxID=1573823 RepID=UPI003217C6F6